MFWKKAFRFDFVMTHVGVYTKCSEMVRFEKSLNFEKECVVWISFGLEQATKRLITYSELVVFCIVYVPLE